MDEQTMDDLEDSRAATHNLLSFCPTQDPEGMTIIDHVERRQCILHTSEEINPRDAPSSEFYFPVDRGVSITTEQLSFPHTVSVYIRNHAGIIIDELTEEGQNDFPQDLYSVEITAPIKIYLVFNEGFSIDVSTNRVELELKTSNEVLVGARSHHESPAATITTTDDPKDMMNAVSYFGSALKTTTVERSYPTLRGHPPTIELGDEVHIPSVLDKPNTGVRLILPCNYKSIYISSTLAYYLGATIEPGDEARLETEEGFIHSFADSSRGFEDEVERVLKQVFLLDCLTRTEGYYPVNLHEREQVEQVVDLDFSELYDKPLALQLEDYLRIPYSALKSEVPDWKLIVDMSLDENYIDMLPFIVNDLAVVRSVQNNPKMKAASEHSKSIKYNENKRFIRSSSRTGIDSAPTPSLVELEEGDSLEHAWIGEGAPLGASKAMIEAFQNRMNREPTTGDIDITVVCNDIEMAEERDIVDRVYGSREDLPFDVNIHREVTTSELREILQMETDFFHYIGHIDTGGFECTNGRFNATDLPGTGIDAFFLNACTSYEQGKNLIKKGGIAGVVTLDDVINSGAERVGKSLAKLLNQGFPLRAALELAKTQSIMGGHYILLGDGNIDIAQSGIGNPILIDVKNDCENIDEYEVELIAYPTKRWSIGSIVMPLLSENRKHYLVPRKIGPFQLSSSDLQEFLEKGNSPIKHHGKILWKDQFDVS